MRSNLAAVCLLTAILPAQQPAAILVDTTGDRLFSVDLTTGAATLLVAISNAATLATAADLAWRPDTQQLWTIDLSGGEIGTLDLTTGLFTQVALSGLNGWQGMAWDPTTQKFYLANQDGNNHVFDPVTGVTSLLGPSGQGLVTGLAVDAAGTLWGIGFSSRILHTIDKVTGVGTPVSTAAATAGSVQGIAFSSTGTLYATNSASLFTIDPITGATATVGPLGATGVFVKGFTTLGNSACPDGTGAVRLMTMTGTSQIGQAFQVAAQQGPTVLPMFLAIGLSSSMLGNTPLPFNLGPLGAPGCFIMSSADVTVFTITGVPVTIGIPNDVSYVGVGLFNQGLILDLNPGANALGLVTTDLQAVFITL